jgi:hypothetical protein
MPGSLIGRNRRRFSAVGNTRAHWPGRHGLCLQNPPAEPQPHGRDENPVAGTRPTPFSPSQTGSPVYSPR